MQACARQRLPDFLKSSRSPNNLMLSFISNPIKPQEDDHIWCSGTVILRQNRGRNCHSRRLAGVVWICHVHDLSFCKDMNANSSDHDSTGLKNIGSFSNMFKNHPKHHKTSPSISMTILSSEPVSFWIQSSLI